MMGYRDMTFCPFWEDCANAKDCHRPLTPSVVAKARAWWGEENGEPPIVQFADMPDCHSSKEAKP